MTAAGGGWKRAGSVAQAPRETRRRAVDGNRYDVIDGEPFVTPAPGVCHA